MSSKHSTRPRRAVRSLQHKPRRGRAKLPDLSSILVALLDGLSLVRTAHAALRHADAYGPEEATLRIGVEALGRVYSDLDGIETQFHRCRERAAGGRR